MTESHVEQAVAARIQAAKRRTEDMRRQRAELAAARQAGLQSRTVAKLKRIYCGTCAKLQRKGTYLRCPLGCGTALCRSRPGCGNTHLKQCDNRPTPTEAAA